jgi:hypothetical protein
MREIEFLPNWYIKTQRRKKLLTLQFAATVGLSIFFGSWSMINSRTITKARDFLDGRQKELMETANRVQDRQRLLNLNQKLQNQSRVDASLGLNVESARVIKLLDRIMPESTSISEVTISTDERIVRSNVVNPVNNGPQIAPDVSRILRVQLKGIAPSNEDVAAVLEGLGSSHLCQELRLNYSTDKMDKEHILREFLIEFTISLDAAKGQL